MFGVTLREKLTKKMVKALKNNLDSYRESLVENKEHMSTLSEKELADYGEVLAKAYFEKVNIEFISYCKKKKPNIEEAVEEYIKKPSILGINVKKGSTYKDLTAGMLYYICYYAIKGKSGVVDDAVHLTHYEKVLLGTVAYEVDPTLVVREE